MKKNLLIPIVLSFSITAAFAQTYICPNPTKIVCTGDDINTCVQTIVGDDGITWHYAMANGKSFKGSNYDFYEANYFGANKTLPPQNCIYYNVSNGSEIWYRNASGINFVPDNSNKQWVAMNSTDYYCYGGAYKQGDYKSCMFMKQ